MKIKARYQYNKETNDAEIVLYSGRDVWAELNVLDASNLIEGINLAIASAFYDLKTPSIPLRENKAARFNKVTETVLDTVENMNTVRQLGALECEDCHVSSMDVVETICPFNQDVHGKEVPATLCTVCYNTRCDEI